MAIHLSAPRATELKPRIVVFGVGGAGGNAVNNMIEAGLEGVEFVVANTDAQQLQYSKTESRIQLGAGVTQGLGAGAHPEVGMTAANESTGEISEYLDGAHMVFITAGMGGGTGTGAAPVIARIARERGILTVGVVTKPFGFEGRHRMRLADAGIIELQRYVDTLIIIPNQNLFRIANERTTFAEAFGLADQVLHSGVRSITDLMVLPGLINLDFADVRAVMSDMGKAMMGTGEGDGENRALHAAQNAIQNPLLDETSLKGAKAVLVNVTGGLDMTLHEVDEAANAISSEVDPDANIIFGAAFDPELDGKIRVSVVATGMDSAISTLQTPVTSTIAQRPSAPTFTPAPRAETPVYTPVAQAPAPVQPTNAFSVAEAVSAPVYTPPVTAPRSSLFEAPAVAQPQAAYAGASHAEMIPAASDMATEDLHKPEPVITRPPSYNAQPAPQIVPQPAVYERPQPVAQPVAPVNHEEAGREAFWRGLFPQRPRTGASYDPVQTQAPQAQPSSQPQNIGMTDDQDRYQPSITRAQAAPRMDIQPAPEAEDDLEIPSFLRRLAN